MRKIPYQTDQNNPAVRAYKEAVEKGKKNQHVLPYGKKWAVTNLASKKVDYISSDPQEAIKYAGLNATQGTVVFIHGPDGRIKERKNY